MACPLARTTISAPLASLLKNWPAKRRRRVERPVRHGAAGSRLRLPRTVEAHIGPWVEMRVAPAPPGARQETVGGTPAPTICPDPPDRYGDPVHQDSNVTGVTGDDDFLVDGFSPTGGRPSDGIVRE